MKGKIGDITWILPDKDELGGNPFYKSPDSRNTIERLFEMNNINNAMEPMYGHTGVSFNADDMGIVKMLDPWTTKCPKCDGIKTNISFLKENKLGLFGRSADCMLLGIVSQDTVQLLHVSLEALNNGILLNLPLSSNKVSYSAILGPCISKSNYSIFGKEYIESRTRNFDALGYSRYTEYIGEHLYIDIRGIVKNTLKSLNIRIEYSDERCTYEYDELGSNRREKDCDLRHDNVILLC